MSEDYVQKLVRNLRQELGLSEAEAQELEGHLRRALGRYFPLSEAEARELERRLRQDLGRYPGLPLAERLVRAAFDAMARAALQELVRQGRAIERQGRYYPARGGGQDA